MMLAAGGFGYYDNRKMRNRPVWTQTQGGDLWKNQRAEGDTVWHKNITMKLFLVALSTVTITSRKCSLPIQSHMWAPICWHSAPPPSTREVPVSSGKPRNDLSLPGVQCWELVLKESLQTLPKTLRKASTATHRSCRAGILEGHCKYCLNRSSKACPMEPMTSWASPSQHSRMWQAWRERDTHSLETVPELSGPLDKEPHLRCREKRLHTSLLACLYQPTVSSL